MADQHAQPEVNSTPPSMPPKRVLPARERRESVTKREASTPISATKPTSSKKSTPSKTTPKTVLNRSSKRKDPPETTPTPRAPSPDIQEPLPTKITESRPLPTSHQPPILNLSSKEYQSFSESAVLALSLHRSRAQWLVEGIFEKYWTKPPKKKGSEVVTNNPDLKSMQKLGSSTIVIGPHTCEAVLYTIRENIAYRHPSQSSPCPVVPQSGFQSFQPVGSPPINPQMQPPTHQTDASIRNVVKQEHVSSTGVDAPTSKVSSQPQPQTLNDIPSALPGSQPGPDPVIRMLATRAATNPDLKALMKIVASSKASAEQLRLFQGHIDELNTMIRLQHETERPPLHEANPRAEGPVSTPAQIGLPDDHPSRRAQLPQAGEPGAILHASIPNSHQPVQPPPHPALKTGHFEPQLNPSPYLPYPPPQHKMVMLEPMIKAIVLEFTTPASSTMPASQDRFLFPEYAVLDIPLSGRGTEMVCSFLVTRKGSDLLALQSKEGNPTGSSMGGLTRWKADEEYYQAVTMTMRSSQPRTLETIARAAKPLQQVQARMTEIMQSGTRVKDEWLVLRLPREKGTAAETHLGRDGGFGDGAAEMEDDQAGSADEDDDLRTSYPF